MLLLEHEGKAVLEKFGIAIPRGRVAKDMETAAAVVAELRPPYVVKAQVLKGGRKKAGGIRPARNGIEAAQESGRLIGSQLMDAPVSAVLIEEEISFERERYLAFLLDGDSVTLMLGKQGGIDVESYFDNERDTFQCAKIDPIYGLSDYQVRKVASRLGIDAGLWGSYATLANKLYRLYRASDATLAEINPLVECVDGKLLALDARIVIDDGALYRHPDFAAISAARTERDSFLASLKRLEIQYVSVGGSVGLVSSGAGVGVTIMDWLDREGTKLSAFVDLDYAIINGKGEEAIRFMLDTFYQDPTIAAIMVNFTTCGLRLDKIAESLLRALAGRACSIKPIFFHLQGNRGPAAQVMLREAGYQAIDSLGEAVRLVATAAKSGAA